jgi:hypothetical protein
MSFDGRWSTSFGAMTLRQEGARVTGTYGRHGTENTIDGEVAGDRFTFRYEETAERGTGWFRLRRASSFAGEYLAEGHARTLPWQGWRGLDGLWDTSLGRLRLVQETGRVWGSSELDANVRLEGDLDDGGRLSFRLRGTALEGSGYLELDADGNILDGEWAEEGQPARELAGRRVLPRLGLTWLVVLEAHRQHALDENEFAYGRALHELFARLPRAQVRHRFYSDEASLMRWSRQVLYLPEPSVLVVAGHGEARGIVAGASVVGLPGIVESLRFADGLKLIHFSCPSCLAGQESARVLQEAPFPVSGYARNADWAQCALADLVYLDMILDKGLAPAKAAEDLVQLVRFAGSEEVPGSPYRPCGFRLIDADAGLAQSMLAPVPGPASRFKFH